MDVQLSQFEDEAIRELGEKAEIDDSLFDEHVPAPSQDMITWFANFANYMASDIDTSYFSFHLQKNS